MPFKGAAPRITRPGTLEELYKELPRKRGAVPGLWLHQGDVLRAYQADHERAADLALELPTGTGKTLLGLVVAEWVRREGAGPVAYACPTNQLARQVRDTAEREGVPAVLLVGSARDWLTADEAAYDSGSAVAVTNYNTVFNSSPKLGDPRLIVFDDAHAGEQFVGDKHGVTISRKRHRDAYGQVLSALSPLLSGLLLHRLQDDTPDPGAHQQVRLLVPALRPDVLAALDQALSRLPKPLIYDFAMVRNGLQSCLVYLSYGSVQIRPAVPPTFENVPFGRARQRVYLSATLGGGGELERAFGRTPIDRLPLPDGAQPRSGRRFFVFPELAAGEPDELVRRIVAEAGKAIVLAQDTTDGAEATAAALAPDGADVLGKDDVEHGLKPFADARQAVLGLANRYDGLDLPHDACRVVVLDGLPNAHSPQERWLGERADAGAALAERVRTRVVQGAGRCTRGPDDFAVVVVRGSDLSRYLNRPDVRAALDPELQAEVAFGWENSAGQSHDDVMVNVRIFLDHDDAWRTGGEPLVVQARRDARKVPPPGSEGLQAAVDAEVAAWELAYQSDFTGASARMQDAAREAGKGGDAARGYRAFLLYSRPSGLAAEPAAPPSTPAPGSSCATPQAPPHAGSGCGRPPRFPVRSGRTSPRSTRPASRRSPPPCRADSTRRRSPLRSSRWSRTSARASTSGTSAGSRPSAGCSARCVQAAGNGPLRLRMGLGLRHVGDGRGEERAGRGEDPAAARHQAGQHPARPARARPPGPASPAGKPRRDRLRAAHRRPRRRGGRRAEPAPDHAEGRPSAGARRPGRLGLLRRDRRRPARRAPA